MSRQIMHHLVALLMAAMILTSGCTGASSTNPGAAPVESAGLSSAPSVTPSQEPTVTTQGTTDAAGIALSDRGRTFTYRLTDRFTVSLDRTRYPVKNLTLTPTGIVGLISNGSINGPDDYPVMFEAVQPGECLLENDDFRVRIVVEP